MTVGKYLKIAEKARKKARFANESVERDPVNSAISGKEASVGEERAPSTAPIYPATKATEATKALGRGVVSASAPATKATKAEGAQATVGFVGLTVGEALKEINRRDSGPAKNAELYRRGELSREKAIEYITCAVLNRWGEPFRRWRRHAPAVEAALTHAARGQAGGAEAKPGEQGGAMSSHDEARREMLRRRLKEVAKKGEEMEADLAAAADESDPERTRAARERLARRDREAAERLADEYQREGEL